MQQYTNLLLGQLEFLRPSKFDFTHMVGGYDTRNKCALMIADPFPLLDMPAYDLCEIDMKSARESDIIKLYRKYGFPIRNTGRLRKPDMQTRYSP